MGEPNETHPEEIEFDWNSSLTASFTGESVSSNAGVLLLRDVDEGLGLTRSLAPKLRDSREPSMTRHPLIELLRERLYLLALGYEDTNDARTMRDDPALKLSVRGAGAEAFRAPLGSQPTISRLEHEILLPRGADGNLTEAALVNLAVLEDAPLRWIETVARKHKAPDRLVLDLDSTEDTVHGKQEGAAYNTYFGSMAFHPLYAHLGDGIGDLVKAQLRPGNVYTSNGVVAFTDPLVPRLLAMTRVLIGRGDSGFADPKLLALFEAHDERVRPEGKRVLYAIKLKSNAVLARLAEPHTKRGPGRPPNHVVEHYVELRYKAESWPAERRVVLLVKWTPGDLFPETAFIATNMSEEDMSGEALYAFYRRRGDDSENRIKEIKSDIKSGRTSCHSFDSNRVRLAFACLAYQLAHWTRCLGRKPGSKTEEPHPSAPSIQMLRLLALKIGARLLLHARRARLLMASSCTAQSLFHAIRSRIRAVVRAAAGSLVRAPLNCVRTL